MTNTTTRMTYTIGEEIEARHGYWSALTVQVCPACVEPFPAISNVDPGSVEEAIGAVLVCDKCCKEHGGYVFTEQKGYVFMSFYDRYPEVRDFERLLWELDNMEEKFTSTPLAELDYEFIADLVELRQCVEDFRFSIVELLKYEYNDNDAMGMMGVEEDEYDHTDLEKEKWDNYWSDYNQCGIHVSY